MSSLHQMLMNRAEEHLGRPNSQWELFRNVSRLPAELMAAELLGWLNYQVENGGFSQWVINGYGIEIRTIIRLLENSIKGPYSLDLAAMLRKIEPYINIYARPNGAFGDYLKEGEDERALDQFDEPYCKIKEELLTEWEVYFHRILYGIRDDGPVRLVDGNLFHFREVQGWDGSHINVDDIIDESRIGVVEEIGGLMSGTIYVGY